MPALLVPKTLGQIAGDPQKVSIPVTDYLVPDEMVWRLDEVNRIDTTSKHVRRWELIFVARNDALAVHIRDMGPASSFNTPELQVIADWCESIGKLRQDANEIRFANGLGIFFQERKGEMAKMVDVWAKWRMELWEQKNNRSHFGPKFKRQRNAFVRSK